MEEIIRIEKLTKHYACCKDIRFIFHNFSLNIFREEIIAIIGPSGCGKTTLMKLIAGIEKPESGKIISEVKNTGFVFQDNRILPWLSLYKNIEIVLKDIPKPRKNKYIHAILEMMELEKYADYPAYRLSGGMIKRAEIARALAVKPEVILFDEAFTNIDYLTKKNLIAYIKKILKRKQITGIYVTHDIPEAIDIASRILVLSETPSTILMDKEIPNELSPEKKGRLESEIIQLFQK